MVGACRSPTCASQKGLAPFSRKKGSGEEETGAYGPLRAPFSDGKAAEIGVLRRKKKNPTTSFTGTRGGAGNKPSTKPMEDTTSAPKRKTQVPAALQEKQEWLARVLADPGLSLAAKAVATRLYLHHNTKDGRCDPRQSLLADGTCLSIRTVSEAVSSLQARGWLTAIRSDSYGSSDYVLNVDRGAADETGGIRAQPRKGIRAQPRKDTRPAAGGIRAQPRTEQEMGTGKEHERLNTAAAKLELPADAEGRGSPVATTTATPAPANDDGAGLGFVEVRGLKVPKTLFEGWAVAFPALGIKSAVAQRARWALSVPEGRRLAALETELGKMNAVAQREQEQVKANAEAKALQASKPPKSRYHF